MSQIEVPDWVVARARAAVREFWKNYKGGHDCGEFDAAMKAAITAALGAWVVPGPYRFLKNGDNPSEWFDRKINGEPPNPKHLREEFRIENAYTLRQEKPE